MAKEFDHIRFILVRPTHPGNIGASARAMKNMGLSRLFLVAPKSFPHEEALTRSSGAEDLLHNAVVTSSLQEAIIDCQLVVGTSSRTRALPWPLLSARECAQKISTASQSTQIAIVFGSERTGLSNDELSLCHFHLYIPCNPEFYSLNLAAAVQVIAYEIRVSSLENSLPMSNHESELVSAQQMSLFYDHLEQTLLQLRFMNAEHPRQLMLKLRRLFNRCKLEHNELNILRGILTAINKKDQI